MDSTVTNVTDSKARRQEKLRRRQERDRQRRAEEIAPIVYMRTFTATAHARRYAQTLPAGSGIESDQLSQYFRK